MNKVGEIPPTNKSTAHLLWLLPRRQGTCTAPNARQRDACVGILGFKARTMELSTDLIGQVTSDSDFNVLRETPGLKSFITAHR